MYVHLDLSLHVVIPDYKATYLLIQLYYYGELNEQFFNYFINTSKVFSKKIDIEAIYIIGVGTGGGVGGWGA